ncbi:RND transporter [Novimethylophilus kurashikiensis]|uniref:RND transporter n=1 Tax=Novimethylophilus kurashikiensis TaxID=1825523 RepID=A0A2R5F8K0_9PROT|nr:hypothetical protein [Novimethylophilus kurashikiensis]GBG14572.1 RND transporter [Novimethylophilus kurashikiensis]
MLIEVKGFTLSFAPLLFIAAVLLNCLATYVMSMAPTRYRRLDQSRRMAFALDAAATLTLIASVVNQGNLLLFAVMLAIATLVGTVLSVGILRGLMWLSQFELPHLN